MVHQFFHSQRSFAQACLPAYHVLLVGDEEMTWLVLVDRDSISILYLFPYITTRCTYFHLLTHYLTRMCIREARELLGNEFFVGSGRESERQIYVGLGKQKTSKRKLYPISCCSFHRVLCIASFTSNWDNFLRILILGQEIIKRAKSL